MGWLSDSLFHSLMHQRLLRKVEKEVGKTGTPACEISLKKGQEYLVWWTSRNGAGGIELSLRRADGEVVPTVRNERGFGVVPAIDGVYQVWASLRVDAGSREAVRVTISVCSVTIPGMHTDGLAVIPSS